MCYKTYKVGCTNQNEKIVPSIRLNGKWLEDLNFEIGQNIGVYVGQNMIVITKPNKEREQPIQEKAKELQIKKLQKQIKLLKN